MNRRDFLRTGAALAATLMVAPTLFRGQAAAAADEDAAVELWLLGTGQEELAPDLYAIVAGQVAPSRIYLPILQK